MARQPLILYAAHPHFQQTNILGEIGEGTGGVTESNRRRVILPFAGGLAETDHVLGHELVHAFQYDMASQVDATAGRSGRACRRCRCGSSKAWRSTCRSARSIRTPRCGCAKPRRATRCRRSTRLDDPDFFPYRYGHAFWAYVAGRWGDRAVGDLLRAAGPDGNIKAAIAAVLGVDEEQLTKEWHEATRRAFAAVYETARPATAFGRALISREQGGGDMNVTPAISPDGKRVVFLSEKSLFSIDMYVADVATGRISRKLVETTSDPHFDSLQFLALGG